MQAASVLSLSLLPTQFSHSGFKCSVTKLQPQPSVVVRVEGNQEMIKVQGRKCVLYANNAAFNMKVSCIPGFGDLRGDSSRFRGCIGRILLFQRFVF